MECDNKVTWLKPMNTILHLSTSWVIMCLCSSYNLNNMWHLYTLPKMPILSFLIEGHAHLRRCLTGLIISCVGRNQEFFWICFYASFNSVLNICRFLVTVKVMHQAWQRKGFCLVLYSREILTEIFGVHD